MLEAAEVNVGRADGGEVVINHHSFAMEHPSVIKVNFHAGSQTLVNVAARGVS